ncbi:MAG TPA: hypothetical protein VMM18_02890, partial [Gemmatimonadaceae bacterium]|nr:hypothetical protein [Gemmatimonadaceae bacterium]
LIDVEEPAAVGALLAANGRVWRDLGIDGHFVGWRTNGWYRPQFHGIGKIFLDTRWLSRFPSGNLGILVVWQGEYRSAVPFPRSDGAADLAPESLVLSALLEVRIVDAVLTFQLRNPRPSRYAQVPGFLMPGPVQYYGVRWAFWN